MTPRNAFRLAACCCLTICSAGCGAISNLQAKRAARKKEEMVKKWAEDAAAVTNARLGDHAVGEVLYVDDESGFVLVRQLTGAVIPPGATLTTKSPDGRSAKLAAASAVKGKFLAVDIVSGTPAKGDGVHLAADNKNAAGSGNAALAASGSAGPSASGGAPSSPAGGAPVLEPLNPPSDGEPAPEMPLAEPPLPQ